MGEDHLLCHHLSRLIAAIAAPRKGCERDSFGERVHGAPPFHDYLYAVFVGTSKPVRP